MKRPHRKIIVYSCSGASTAAQMANALAIKLDRAGIADMSCIAGVGGGVKSLVNKAKNADIIISLDGCPLHCVEQCLQQHGIRSTVHYDLSRMGVSKAYHTDFDPAQAQIIFDRLAPELRRLLNSPEVTEEILTD